MTLTSKVFGLFQLAEIKVLFVSCMDFLGCWCVGWLKGSQVIFDVKSCAITPGAGACAILTS